MQVKLTLSFLLLQQLVVTGIFWYQTPVKISYLILLTQAVWCLQAQLLYFETEKLHPADQRKMTEFVIILS